MPARSYLSFSKAVAAMIRNEQHAYYLVSPLDGDTSDTAEYFRKPFDDEQVTYFEVSLDGEAVAGYIMLTWYQEEGGGLTDGIVYGFKML